jgi:hypothetical protein
MHLGRNIQGRDRYILTSARRKLERLGIVFVPETGVGVVRASHPQVAHLATKAPIEKIARTARRAKKREQLVDIQQLTAEQRLVFNIGRAVLGAVEQGVRLALRNEIKKEVEKADGPIPVTKTLDLFNKIRFKTSRCNASPRVASHRCASRRLVSRRFASRRNATSYISFG